ncbi:aquaporin-like [Pectinophora gossypiella]|uniref:aquaporin-like n=1 Tax=Pectinophora gossypiella TaxID=13191 RepID=UPI00214E6A3C|nr:aquaporin-like [Pectinophora gossypiella]
MTVPPNPQSIFTMVDTKVKNDEPGSKAMKWCSSQWRRIFAELVSTCGLLLLGCMTTIPIDGVPYQQPLYSPLGFGFVVMFNIQIFGHISGAHMNPSVTLASVLWGATSILTAIAYFIAQCTGAILGYGILLFMSPVDLSAGGVCVTQVHHALNVWQGLAVEVALTSTLNFLNCGVWDPVNKNKQDSVPVKFGLAIAGLSLCGGPLTGASMNPARSLAPALLTGLWRDHWIYWVGPFIGAVLPTLLYKYVWLKKEDSVIVSPGVPIISS